MQLTFSSFDKTITADFKQLPFEKLLFFGTWCSEYLYTKYAQYLKEMGDDEGYEILTNAISYLWATVDKPSLIEESVVDEHIDNLHTIDIDNFDLVEVNDTGIMKVMECIESALVYIEEKNYEFIVASAYFPLDVIDVIMTNELGLDTNDPNKHIEHPLLKEEFDAQFKLIEYLKTHDGLTSADKHIFR
ncbi:DUF416 family protein [Chitinophaga sp. CF118]|uniref:DUF416 family protein n=1 Tax=Chitinophaga sp. CF118 TaxID=1884367 RepID=UPI000B7FC02E|nr:DUF416 family protein [Chitinophaga sp. CF118]